jgi:transketolase
MFNFEAIVPSDGNQMDRAIRYAADRDENVFIGAGRSKYPILTKDDGSVLFGDSYSFVYGKDDWVREGVDGVIIGLGHMVHYAMEAHEILKKEGLKIAVIAKSCPKEIDELVINKAAKLPFIITVEDHNIMTGIGSIISEHVSTLNERPKIVKLGITKYAPSGKASDLYRLFGLDGESIAAKVRELVKK